MDWPSTLELTRTGPADATVGVISLPLPRDGGDWRIDHPQSAGHPVAWWQRGRVPRRMMSYVLDDAGVPDTLTLTDAPAAAPASDAWSWGTNITHEQLQYVHPSFRDIESLRGVPADDCTLVQSEVELRFGDRTIAIQCGATGPTDGPHWWQNVQIDPLWTNAAAQAVRLGGVIYNGDTYLWADVYVVLFANGVGHVAAHFVNTKLHIAGYDFQGLPILRVRGEGIRSPAADVLRVPADGLRFDLGALDLNLAESALTCSDDEPGTLTFGQDEVQWRPVSRVFNPWKEDAPPTEWPIGWARTFRLQFSLSDAAPIVARYRVPAWWYTHCGEPWGYDFLPVRGRLHHMGETMALQAAGAMRAGRFDAGFAGMVDDGDGGAGMIINYYLTGRPELHTAALDYGYYWNDLHVDHNDFTVRQHIGGWGWKTCAYTKFRDVLFTYLETGDPHLRDVTEMAAEAYWTWYRSNWPRSAIGRDNFELGAWALMARYFDSDHARDRLAELIRMNQVVLESRGSIGGQMGAGPHPGFHSSLYMTAVTAMSLLDAAEGMIERGETSDLPGISELLRILHRQYIRDDVEVFPSNLGQPRADWGHGSGHSSLWSLAAARIYTEMVRLDEDDQPLARAGWDKINESRECLEPIDLPRSRPVIYYTNPWHADAAMLGARVAGDGVELSPIGRPCDWPAEQTVLTPLGDLTIEMAPNSRSATWRFSAEREFPVTVRYGNAVTESSSMGQCILTPAAG